MIQQICSSIYIPQEMEPYLSTNIRMQMFINLFTITKNWEKPNCPSADEWTNKCDRSIQWNMIWQKKEVLTHATTWVHLESIVLSERSLSQNTTYCMIPFIHNVQNRQIHIERKTTWLSEVSWREMGNDC